MKSICCVPRRYQLVRFVARECGSLLGFLDLLQHLACDDTRRNLCLVRRACVNVGRSAGAFTSMPYTRPSADRDFRILLTNSGRQLCKNRASPDHWQDTT